MRVLALLLFIFLLPLSLLIGILLFLSLRESVIFSQARLGINKKEFIIYKFKTMKDGKITSVGKVLRKLGLDEIPQLANILKNEMNFVGPRPLTQEDVIRLNWNKPEFEKRWSVVPGITCLAQLSPICNADNSMKNDLFYVDNQSAQLNRKIMWKTLLVPFIGKRTH